MNKRTARHALAINNVFEVALTQVHAGAPMSDASSEMVILRFCFRRPSFGPSFTSALSTERDASASHSSVHEGTSPLSGGGRVVIIASLCCARSLWRQMGGTSEGREGGAASGSGAGGGRTGGDASTRRGRRGSFRGFLIPYPEFGIGTSGNICVMTWLIGVGGMS